MNENNRGGSRKGSGRKPAEHKKKQVSVYLSVEILKKLDEQDTSRSSLIERALVDYFYKGVK